MPSFILRTNHTDNNNNNDDDDDDDDDNDPVSYTSYLTTNCKRSRRSSNNTTPSSTHHTHISHNTHESYTPLSPTLTTDSDPPPPPPSSSSTTSGTALDQYLSTSVTNLTAELHRIRSLRRMDSIRYENTISRLKRHVHHLEQNAEEARLASETIQTQSEQGLEWMNEGRKRALARVQELEFRLRESEDHHPTDTDWQGVREDTEILRRKNTLLERKVTAMEEETELFCLETFEMEGSRLPSTPSLTSPLAARIGSSSSTSPYHTTTNNDDEPILSPAQPSILKELNKTRLQLADSERNVRILTRLRTENELKLKNLSKIMEGRWEEFRKELLTVEEPHETMERNKDEEDKGGWVPQDHKSDIGTQPDENVSPEISTIVRRLRTLSSNLTTTRAECDRLTTRLSTANCRIESLEDEAKRKEVVIQKEKNTRETTENKLEEVRTECRAIKARERVWKREATEMRGLLDTYKKREGGESGVGGVVTGKGGVAGGKRRRSEVTDTSEGNHNSNDNDPIVSGLRCSERYIAPDEIRILEERFTDANARAASSSMESVRVSKGNFPHKDYSHMNQTNQKMPIIPRVIQKQSNPKYITKHFRERSFPPLSIPGDNYFLSPFLVFVRLNCIEVVTAKEEDVISRQKINKIEVDQIGIRCRFCAHRNYDERRKRSACYPSTISRIYQSISMMIRDHFMACDDMPIDVREIYIYLKTSTTRGSNNSKDYWEKSARCLGMVDFENRNGIYLNTILPKKTCNGLTHNLKVIG